MAPHYGNNGQLSRDERVSLYGIDCEDQVVWHEWTPGVESVKDLVLQNVALVTQKVKFSLPTTKEFDMPYPQPFKLAPGMKKTIPISFRPAKYEPHVDRVEILTKGGSFYVTVKAVVKDIALTVPQLVNFGLCPTSEMSRQHIEVYNTGTLKACMQWHAKPPFAVKAPTTSIDVGQMVRCTIEFQPTTASVFDGLIVCEASRFMDHSSAGSVLEDDAQGSVSNLPADSAKRYFVQSTGVGKLPHLCVPGVPSPVVEFGSVSPGHRVPQTLEVLNTTPVRATFHVRPLHDGGEVSPVSPSPFFVTPESGTVEPSCPFVLTFYFQSHTVKEHACQRFQITTHGGTPLVVTCTAFCRPLEVRLSMQSINFGEVPSGKVASRTLQIHNDSDRASPYHFINADLKGIFWFDRMVGVVPPNSFMVVTVFFGPLAPINYYKQVSCVVKGTLTPLTLHLMGSVHSEKGRPARLEQHHIDVFRAMQADGIPEHPPPAEEPQPEDRGEEDGPAEEERTQEVSMQAPSATASFLELMLPMDSALRDITVAPADLDFGSCSAMTMNDKQSVVIANETSQKVSVVWMLPGDTRLPCTADEKAVFSVFPVQCDIKPRGSQEFAVSFRPQSEKGYEGGMLEAVVFQKINRNFRLVNLKRFTPPWTVAIRGVGHTMGSTRNDPRLDMSESNVRFRACYPGDRSYQVAMLTNPGDTRISYKILPPVDVADLGGSPDLGRLTSVPFRAWPTQGTISPHQFHLVVLEFAPTFPRNESAFVANFQIVVDYNESHPKNLRVAGRAWEPRLSFCRGQPTVTFPPTCSGIASTMTCQIKNISEVPVSYECKIPSRYRSLFWFSDPFGRLLPSESSSVVAHFCPNSEKVFSAPMYCVARCVSDPDNVVEGPMKALMSDTTGMSDATPAYVLQFVGHGKAPALSVDPDNLDFGAVKAWDETKHSVMILNSSNLTVHYSVDYTFIDVPEAPPKEAALRALTLGHSDGSVAGRCTDTLELTFAPPCRGRFEYRITVTPKGEWGVSPARGVSLTYRAEVQYPCVQIADLRTASATLQPQSMMWIQFQVDGLNELYAGEPADVERRFQAAIGIDEKKELVKQLKPFQLLFGTSAVGSPATVVYVVLNNPSQLKLNFSFQTPKDLNLDEPPHWCDVKALVDEREAHFSWVEEHGIYHIEPKSGEIFPGDFVYIRMSYLHQSVGTHILPVVFNVQDGRSSLLYLKAHSVAANVGCLSVRSSVVSLQPVPLHVGRGPMQPVELTNSGCVAAPWRIDMQSICEHNAQNYDFEVLSVTPAEGVLEPQSSTFLHFTFTPLEAKQYVCPIRLEMLKGGRAAEELCFNLHARGSPGTRIPKEPHFPVNLPIQTYAPVPGYGAALSIEFLDFGRCPLRACISRILVLVNYSSEYVLSYSWEPRRLFRPSSHLQIEPRRGELSPGSHCIIVFRLCCTEPIDVSGEVACMLDWVHMSEYGKDIMAGCDEDIPPKAEYLAFHSDHVHEAFKSGKGLIAGSERPHISVTNRLTVSRFRNLMSTAAGQKFLNENLHRNAVLATHLALPMQQSKASAKTRQSQTNNSTMNDSFDTMTGGVAPREPPTSNPLYVRVRAAVADWEVEPEQRDDFLILGPSVELEAGDAEEEADETLDSVQLRNPNLSTTSQHSTSSDPACKLGPGLIRDTLENMIQEVMSEDEFGNILDNMLAEETPYFLQFEDSAPPGSSDPYEAGRSLKLNPFAFADMDVPAAPVAGSSAAWSSPLLLDFPAPAAASAPVPAPPVETAEALTSSPSAADPDADTAQRHWEEALNEYGEVDLEAFKMSAGDVLDRMLLDMMDDVIGGRLNWLRPLPKRSRR